MRSAQIGLAIFLACVSVSPAEVTAQDDEDEFDDDFEDEADEQDEPADATPRRRAATNSNQQTPEAAPNAAATPLSWDDHFRLQSSWGGPIGGIHVVDARTGGAGSFRAQLAIDFFSASDFLNNGDSNDRIGGVFSLSWSVLDILEVYASVASYANRNDTESPQLLQTLGDTTVGIKGGYSVLPWLSIGGDASVLLLNSVGDIGVGLRSTGFGLRANATADFRALAVHLPLIGRFNARYDFDNSANLIEDVEQARYRELPDPAPGGMSDESRHLISRVERFGLNINRVDRFTFALGVEAPLEVSEHFSIHPIAEWQLSVPVNRQGYDCLFIPSSEGSSEPTAGTDGCLKNQGISAYPQVLTLGVRVLPPVVGLSAFAAVDIGLTGVSTFVRELAPTKPYDVLLGISYAYDARPRRPTPTGAPSAAPTQTPQAVRGRIRGAVVDKESRAAVANAVVRFPGRELTALHTGEDGKFTSYELAPGEVQLDVTAPDYNAGTCSGRIPAHGGDVQVQCELVPLPRLGTVRGRITENEGGAVAGATIQMTGPSNRTFTTDANGAFEASDVAPGSYLVRAESPDHLLKQQPLTVVAQQTVTLEVALTKKPKNPLVELRRREIVIRKQINFATDSDEIIASSFPLMTEIADVLLRNPQIRLVEIQGHTDNRGNRTHNQELSQKRAESVRAWLVQAGVEPSRLEARGYGPSLPLVPNITAANRARNRRVQFIIKDQGAEEGGSTSPAAGPNDRPNP